MPATALQHFREDISRARELVAHADLLSSTEPTAQLVRSDILRSGWMFAVGALDAYFCDAYTDVVAAMANSKSRQPEIALPDWALDIKVPIRTVLESYDHANWRWRMAARRMMERENVVSLVAIQNLFNKFLRKGKRFFRDLIDSWIAHDDSKVRLFATTRDDTGPCPIHKSKWLAKSPWTSWKIGFGTFSKGDTTEFTTATDPESLRNRSRNPGR